MRAIVKRFLQNNIKNILGWRTVEKLVVLEFDDYGNVRQDSVASKQRMIDAGLKMTNRFDGFDSVESRQDLEALFEVLSSVSDGRGRPAILTPYTLCANPDFDAIVADNTAYQYESLPQTFARLEDAHGLSYRGAWDLWQEGIRLGLLKPQFHGREHLNVELLERKLRSGDKTLKINLENRSLTALGGEPSMPGVGFTQAFAFWDLSELDRHRQVLSDGMDLFERTFGFPSKTFTPPAQHLHPELYPYVERLGVRAIDKPFYCVRRLNRHESKREFNVLGPCAGYDHVSIVRNVVFEPTDDRNVDSVTRAFDQVSAAFRWRRPAVISSHRVNFAGHIDPENRTFGLASLKRFLDRIVKRWPDVQFISADMLLDKIQATPR
jgi:hypothetical protein